MDEDGVHTGFGAIYIGQSRQGADARLCLGADVQHKKNVGPGFSGHVRP